MSTRSRWNCVFWLGMGVCFASFACSIAAGPLRDAYFSADQLYLPTLLADLTRWGGDLAAWHLTPAPYFFPDLVLYAVAWQLTRGLPYSIEAAQYLTGILQLAWLVLVARALVHRTLPSDCRACALIAPIWAVWISLYLAGAGAVVLPGLVFSSHSGALLSTLTVFALTLRPAHAPRALGTLCVVALSFLTGASDALFVMSCSAVLAVTAGWCSIAPRSSLAAPVSLLRAWLGAVAGIAGLVASRRLGFASAAQLDGSFDVALEDARKIWTESDAFPRATVLALLLVAGFATYTLLRSRSRPALRILASWQLLATCSVLVATFYTGVYGDRSSLRYFIVPCHLALVFFAATLASRSNVARAPHSLPVAMTALSLVALCLGTVVAMSLLSSARFAAPQRAATACVRDVAQREGVNAVLADYWYAKPLMLLADDRAHVIQVRGGLQPYLWINSRSWYRGPHEFGVIISTGMNVPRIRKLLGEPQAIEHCDNLELFVYRDRARAHMKRRVQAMFDRVLAGYAAR